MIVMIFSKTIAKLNLILKFISKKCAKNYFN